MFQEAMSSELFYLCNSNLFPIVQSLHLYKQRKHLRVRGRKESREGDGEEVLGRKRSQLALIKTNVLKRESKRGK